MRSIMESEAKSAVLIIIAIIILPKIFLLCCRNSFHRHLQTLKNITALSAVVIVVAVVGKLTGCGLSATIFLRDISIAMSVGIGMISRAEMGLIVAGCGVSSGVLSSNVYTAIIIMVAVTTVITPVW
jgi:Kef-type K+ transport system membrane component KefB